MSVFVLIAVIADAIVSSIFTFGWEPIGPAAVRWRVAAAPERASVHVVRAQKAKASCRGGSDRKTGCVLKL